MLWFSSSHPCFPLLEIVEGNGVACVSALLYGLAPLLSTCQNFNYLKEVIKCLLCALWFQAMKKQSPKSTCSNREGRLGNPRSWVCKINHCLSAGLMYQKVFGGWFVGRKKCVKSLPTRYSFILEWNRNKNTDPDWKIVGKVICKYVDGRSWKLKKKNPVSETSQNQSVCR